MVVFALTAAISPFMVLLALSPLRASVENCSHWLFLELEEALEESLLMGNARILGHDSSPCGPQDHTCPNIFQDELSEKRLQG